MELPANSANRWPELDGLRGVAILLVLCLHYITNNRTTDQGFGYLYRFAQVFRLGWTGVDLFFVLSGFLIGGILLEARNSSSYFKAFYVRRVHRILPIYYAWITLYAVIACLLVGGNRLPQLDQHAILTQVFVHYLFLQNLVPTPHPAFSHYAVAVTWSLAIEEQFYLVAPMLVRYLSIRRLTQVLIGCIVGAPVLRAVLCAQLAGGKDLAYVLMPCRADALAMGMLAAVAWRTNARGWLERHSAQLKVALGVLVCGALVMLKWPPRAARPLAAGGEYSWFAALYTCVVLLALLHRDGIIARAARCTFLREWGRVSYGVYLIHLGILGTCHWVLLHSLPRLTDLPGVLTTLLAVGLTWGIAQVSFKYFEKPLIDRGHAYRYQPVRSRAARTPTAAAAFEVE